MDELIALIVRLCALSCLSALCQLLLGPGRLRGHVRLVCGLLLLHMMVSQLSALLGVAAQAPGGAP